MAFYKMKREQRTFLLVSAILFAVLMMAGCAAKKTQTAQPEAPAQEATAALDRQLNAILLEQEGQQAAVRILGNQKLTFTSIKQEFPFGIAVYLPETQIGKDFKKNVEINDNISDVVIGYADEEKTTVKVEILLKADLNYDVIESDDSILVVLNENAESLKVVETLTSSPSQDIQPKRAVDRKISTPVVVPDATATMTHIEFNTMEDGTSDIIVHTNHPVKFDTAQKGYDTIYLNLYNTVIPEHHKRPLLTQYFKSAVESLLPVQVPGKDKNSKIAIKIRQSVPYQIVQNQNTISLFFEPSTVEPPVFTKAKKKVVSGTQASQAAPGQGSIAESQTSPAGQQIAEKNMQEEIEDTFTPKKKYTGEKIKLDFYETDIKNVFRILRSVGGKNFAIDKDVEGQVTLTLEDPVPWDQVLDLVLKMNNLGIKQEGNVIRIATLKKLKDEEKQVQEAIAARKKTIEDSKALEPLITEYIPINYSDAKTDILPHIEKILTEKRGKISVDTRTNMVIITDVQTKIDQAKEIIYRLDKVTPQIMIEAKVVEVTKDFTRELGLGLSFTKSQTEWTGRDNDFTVALNSPVTAPVNSGSFNFYRILGSNFLSMNAQIRASETKGDVKIVSSPRILTLDNKKAMIKQGLEYAYLERDDSGGSSVKFKNIDLLLEVTPHVTPDKRISMNVYLTKNDIDTITDGVPSLATNEAETELLVNNNDTVVIGGIVKTTDTDSSSGTPYLSGIPIIGRLFRTDIDNKKRNELLIFLTPSIVQLEQRKNTFTSSN